MAESKFRGESAMQNNYLRKFINGGKQMTFYYAWYSTCRYRSLNEFAKVFTYSWNEPNYDGEIILTWI